MATNTFAANDSWQDADGFNEVDVNDRGSLHTRCDKTPRPKPVEHDPAIIDLRQLLLSIEGDVRLMRELAVLFQSSSGKHLALLAAAMEKLDPIEIRGAAHAFKGSAGGMRAQELWDILAGIEAAARAGDLASAQAGYASVAPAMERLLRHLDEILMRAPA